MAEPAFVSWCDKHGIQTSGVQPGYVSEGYRGIIATEQVQPDSVIMSIPQELLMSVMSARRDPQLSAALRQHQLESHQVLSIHLLHEASKGDTSFWHPYIRQLPQQYTAFLTWPAVVVPELQLQYGQEAAAAAEATARSHWLAAKPVLQELGLPKKYWSWRAWCWAASCVLSRTMYHPDDPPCGCLTPLADLHNHQPPPAPHEVTLLQGAQQLLQQKLAEACMDLCRSGGQPSSSSSRDLLVAQQIAAVTEIDLIDVQQCTNNPEVECVISQHQQHLPEHQTPASPLQQLEVQSNTKSPAQQHQPVQHAAQPAAQPAAQQQQQVQSAAAEMSCCSTPGDFTSAADGGNSSSGSSAESWGDGHFDCQDRMYKIVARARYHPGDQVFLCYGRHTNLALLELYGFLLDYNPHNTALLQPTLLQQALHHVAEQQRHGQGRHWKRRPKQQAMPNIGVSEVDCWVSAAGSPSWELLKSLRLAAARPDAVNSAGHLALAGNPISLASELLVLQCLALACQQMLDSLPTTAADDEAILQRLMPPTLQAASSLEGSVMCASEAVSTPISCGCAQHDKTQQQPTEHTGQHEEQQRHQQCLQLAIQWRLGYKQSLMNCMQQCRQALALLGSSRH